jgi:hypothetical protein
MPVVGSSAYNTPGQITSLMRSLLNDAQGNLFTDAVLLPYANSAYRKLQRALGNACGDEFIQDDVLLVVTAVMATDTSLQVSITDATAPLPNDLLVPIKIWERPNGSSDEFCEMVDLTRHDGLPSRAQDVNLSVWEWRADGLYFLGATQDTQIRLRCEGVSRFYGRDLGGFDSQRAGGDSVCDRGIGGMVAWKSTGAKVG